MTDVLRVIEEFNNKHNIKDVIESITGVQIKRKSYVAHFMGEIITMEQVSIQQRIFLLAGRVIVEEG